MVLTVLIRFAVRQATMFNSSEDVQAMKTSADFIEACFKTSILEAFPEIKPTSSLLKASALLCSSSITVISFEV